MRYRFFTLDVFTDSRFGGNQLAVLPEAAGLSAGQMQQIAREFNFAESTFVLPAEQGQTARVRIFTPTAEVPFAGHPNIGTATALALAGRLGTLDAPMTIRFEEKAGLVPIIISPRAGKPPWCSLSAPERLSLGAVPPIDLVAAAGSLDPAQIRTAHHPPRTASVGLPFIIAELRDRAALEAASPSIEGAKALRARGFVPDIHLYLRSEGEFEVRARMFAPLDGVFEDPATGSASCALAGLLASLDPAPRGSYRYRIAQGVEMGRPSQLEARAEKVDGVVVETGVAGSAVLVMEGHIEVE